MALLRFLSGSLHNAARHCQCELADEAKRRDLYVEHALSTDGLWSGPVPLSAWKEQFLPSVNAIARKVDFSSVPVLNGQDTFVRVANRSCSIQTLNETSVGCLRPQ